MNDNKQKLVVDLIEDVWASLVTHLPWCYGKSVGCKYCGGAKFHRQCVKDYAQMIEKLSRLL